MLLWVSYIYTYIYIYIYTYIYLYYRFYLPTQLLYISTFPGTINFVRTLHAKGLPWVACRSKASIRTSYILVYIAGWLGWLLVVIDVIDNHHLIWKRPITPEHLRERDDHENCAIALDASRKCSSSSPYKFSPWEFTWLHICTDACAYKVNAPVAGRLKIFVFHLSQIT